MGVIDKFRVLPLKGLAEEVRESLFHILGVKEGFGSWQRGLGLGDHSSISSSERIIKNLMGEIQFNIETFEKRLTLHRIRLLSSYNSYSFCFQVEGDINGDRTSFLIFFNGPHLCRVNLQTN